MKVALPRKAMPVTLAGVSCAVAGLCLWRFLVGDGYDFLLGSAWFGIGGALFFHSSRRPILQVRDGMLLCYNITVPLTNIRAARIVRFWEDGGPARILELQLLEQLNLSWPTRFIDRYSSMWRFRWYRDWVGYTPPREPFYLIYLPETDVSDEDIVNALRPQ